MENDYLLRGSYPYNTRFVFHSSPIRKSTVQNGQLHYTIIAFPGFQCFCGQNKKIHHLKAALPIPGEVRPPSVDTVYTDSIIFLSFLQTVQPLRLLYFSALIRFIPWKKQQKNNSRSLRKRIFENRLFIVVQTPSGRQASSGSPADPPGGSAPDRETTPRRRKAARQGSRMVLRESGPK